MHVDCPECGASLAGSPGAEMVCPACMTPFLVPSLARAVRAFDVQPSGDAVIHAMSRHAIREAIYVGRLDAAARVRHEGGKWELIGGYPEFAAVFRLLGGDLAPMAGTRKLAGWGRGGAARRDLEEPTAPSRTPAPARVSGPPPRSAPQPNPALRSPTLVPPPGPNAPPPPLPAATAPATAATLAAVEAERAGLVEPSSPSLARPVLAVEEPAPSRGPWLAVGGLVVIALAAAFALS